MQFDVVYIESPGYVSATLSGDVVDEVLKTARGEMNSKLLAHDCKRLLVDAGGVSHMQSIISDFEFTAEHRTKLPPGTRHAVVIKDEHRPHMQFVEDVAQNRSINLKLFTDRNAAIEWLCTE